MPYQAINPQTGQPIGPAYDDATPTQIDAALQAAHSAFPSLRALPPETRAALLEDIADRIEAIGDLLLDIAHQETALPLPRLTGERARTVSQARLFAQVIREGHWLDARIDTPDPARQPLPKPDVRSLLRPIGPVVVFGASNFPLAISVAGADTLSALGAGCPVVVKAHPAHPTTCQLVADAITASVAALGLPTGTFTLLHGRSHEVGHALVTHHRTQAVAFTGSLQGGRALFDAAAARLAPIPVYAEMGSANPVFLLPGALAARATEIAQGYVGSVSLGVGQFCTCPSLVFGLQGPSLDTFTQAAAAAAAAVAPASMLHPGIHQAYRQGIARFESLGLEPLASSAQSPDPAAHQAELRLFAADADLLAQHPDLHDEVFGPSSLIFRCASKAALLDRATELEGSLTATIHGTPEDLADNAELVSLLESKVGRLIFNGYPTGIEVCHAMHHGGPYPATTHSFFTSIGTRSFLRFARPVCYQNWPDAALPKELQDANPLKIPRLVDGQLTSTPLS
jgi:2,5-dioxopentanoate dehydrogenase